MIEYDILFGNLLLFLLKSQYNGLENDGENEDD